MSDLTFLEKQKLEKQFQMGNGYVLDFSNRTFAEFVADCCGMDIYNSKYEDGGSSKANRLRSYWLKESNHLVGKLINDLLEYSKPKFNDPEKILLFEDCKRISMRLLQSSPVEAIDAISGVGTERGFEVLARAVRDSIEKNEPEAGLDRLHTYVTKLIRSMAERRGIKNDKDKPLHSIFGEYVKVLRVTGIIDSEMTDRILKSSIGTLEAFNNVRNNRSLAHDNPVLGYEESLFIFNHVCSVVRFIRALEDRIDKSTSSESIDEVIKWDD